MFTLEAQRNKETRRGGGGGWGAGVSCELNFLVTMRTARGAKKFMLKIFHNKPVRRGGCGMNTLERCECQSGRAVLFGWKVQHLREVSKKMPQIFDTQF